MMFGQPAAAASGEGFLEEGGDLVVVFDAVETFLNVARHAGEHGADQAVGFEGGEIVEFEKVHRGQADAFGGGAKIVEGNVLVAPTADGLAEAAGEGSGGGGGAGRGEGGAGGGGEGGGFDGLAAGHNHGRHVVYVCGGVLGL